MTKQQRAEMLRERFRARFPVFRYEPGERTPREPARRWANERRRRGFKLINYGLSRCTQQSKWVREHEAREAVPVPHEKRLARVSPLHVIARKLAVKPKRETK